MDLKEYLKKNKKTIRGFGKEFKISHYSMQKYIHGSKPAPRQAWKIFNATDGKVTFQDIGYDEPPKNPLKDI
jgi:hypothetical protein